MKVQFLFFNLLVLTGMVGCNPKTKKTESAEQDATGSEKIRLITLDPGHFHAALVQKNMYAGVDSQVHVYAPGGEDLQEHLKKIKAFNARKEEPTHWKEEVYEGKDYLEKMLKEKAGNVVVLAGNNQKKTEYIKAAIEAGLNVLSDKPMAINTRNFELLKEAFADAEKKKVLLYDIMTERYEITTMLQREFSMLPGVFGTLQQGTTAEPAITKESVHHFFKNVAGAPLKRPSWFFDVTQQGEGITDVTSHLVDLVQWECFPEQIINYKNDIQIVNAYHWKTILTFDQFKKVTQLTSYPAYLQKDVDQHNSLEVYSNGEINYRIKGVHAKVSVTWKFEAPEGAGDTHFSMMKGSRSSLIIRQGKEQNYSPQLFIEPVKNTDLKAFEATLKSGLLKIQQKYPGLEAKRKGNSWIICAPEKYHNGHEAHFGQVMAKYLQFLTEGKMPEWEVPNMIAKYYTTTKALELAQQKK